MQLYHTDGNLYHFSKRNLTESKLIDIYCSDPAVYFNFLKRYDLEQTDKLVMAWDTFSHETPGEVRRIEMNGISAFDVYDELVKIGMYDAKIIED